MSRTYRVALIGCRSRGTAQARAVTQHPRTELVAVCDLLPERRDALGERFGVGARYADFRQMLRELQPRFPDVFLCTVNWYQVVDPAGYFRRPGDHAGEMETSVLLHAAPELVGPLSDAGPGAARQFKLRGLRERWAWAPRQWTRVTDDTGVGDPRGATAEQGARYAHAVTERIAEFLTELAAADVHDLYE